MRRRGARLQLAREGVDIRSRLSRSSASPPRGGKIEVVIRGSGGEETIAGSHLLVATGRRANTDGLALEQAGIVCDRNGIVVNKRLKTSNRRVYAIGDVAGRRQFTHLANYHAGLVIRNALFRLPVGSNEDLVPRVTFTDPELAQVGLTETEARARRRADPRAAMALSRERPRPDRARDDRAHQGDDRPQRPDSRRHHRGRGRRRVDHAPGRWRSARTSTSVPLPVS